ncbi:MAG: hypothetical protein JW810_02420 [Sedimentisphaerales bacterium]|nr:hypothetical protein [Sedimentisphaerales bacterium]
MKILLNRQIDRDFVGGIYLTALGDLPALERIEPVDYEGPLLVPLQIGSVPLSMQVRTGQCVSRGDLLARAADYCLYAPRPARIAGTQQVRTEGIRPCEALVLDPLPDCQRFDQTDPAGPADAPEGAAEGVFPAQASHPAVWRQIEEAGIVSIETAEGLGQRLRHLEQREEIRTVIANATPLEPMLNAPLALLHQWNEQVFAGLAILKTWLAAQDAILAYPHDFALDTRPAHIWQVRCVPVSEKYPQGRAGSVLRTLEKMKQLPQRQRRKRSAVVFSIQLLRQVERAVLAGQKPLERVVTVCGDGVAHPGHFLAPLGLPVGVLLRQAGIHPDTQCVVEDSSLTGSAIDPDAAVVGPCTEALIAIRRARQDPCQPCIRCGWCIDDCPAQIDPVRLLHWAQTGQYQRARRGGVHACIECGICSYICPSRLRIMEHIQMIKRKLREGQRSDA